jgi:hypothetical protein
MPSIGTPSTLSTKFSKDAADLKPLFIGYSESGERIALTDKDLETHVHGIGASRTGKSKLIEWMARELIRDRQGFMLIDPHGFLYEDILRWLTYVRPRREIVLFNPSLESRIVGFNPFRPGPDHISTQVDRRVRATVKAWGAEGTDATPRLERWLRCFYHTLIELDLPIDIGRYFFTWQPQSMRRFLARGVKDTLVRNEWEELLSYDRPQEFTGQIESARNRLFRFILPLQIRRVMGLATNIIDLENIVEEGKILLVNLQPSGTLSDENANLIGTLLLNELWEIGKRRKQGAGGKPPSRFFVVIDEFQKFLTQDIPTMLDQSAKYGLTYFFFTSTSASCARKTQKYTERLRTPGPSWSSAASPEKMRARWRSRFFRGKLTSRASNISSSRRNFGRSWAGRPCTLRAVCFHMEVRPPKEKRGRPAPKNGCPIPLRLSLRARALRRGRRIFLFSIPKRSKRFRACSFTHSKNACGSCRID